MTSCTCTHARACAYAAGSSEDSADDCLAAAKASLMGARINYVIYNAGTKGCYLCDMTDRGPYKNPVRAYAHAENSCTCAWHSYGTAYGEKFEDKETRAHIFLAAILFISFALS